MELILTETDNKSVNDKNFVIKRLLPSNKPQGLALQSFTLLIYPILFSSMIRIIEFYSPVFLKEALGSIEGA